MSGSGFSSSHMEMLRLISVINLCFGKASFRGLRDSVGRSVKLTLWLGIK